MLSRLRIVSLLMLLAGAALGVFAAEALTGKKYTPGTPTSYAPRIEEKVKRYVDYYDLDTGQAETIRRALVEYDLGVHNLLRELREKEVARFHGLLEQATQRIDAVLKEGK